MTKLFKNQYAQFKKFGKSLRGGLIGQNCFSASDNSIDRKFIKL